MFQFQGRGSAAVSDDSLFLLEVDDGSVLAVTQRVGSVEFMLGYCRMAVADKWGVYCHELFRRAYDPGMTRSWAHVEQDGKHLFRGVRFHLMSEEEWMTRSE